MELSRRKLLGAGVVGAAGIMVAGCTSAQLAQAQQDLANFIDQVNQTLSAGCSSLIPAFTATANTVEAVVSALYPSIGAAIAVGAAAVTNVANIICSAVPTNPAPAAQLRRRLLGSSSGVPTVIGTVVIGGKPITVTGYKRAG